MSWFRGRSRLVEPQGQERAKVAQGLLIDHILGKPNDNMLLTTCFGHSNSVVSENNRQYGQVSETGHKTWL